MKKREKYKLNWAALLLAAALARADEIAAESGLDFPRLLTLEGAELGGNGALRDIYPAFAPETTTYLFCSATSQTRGSSIDDIHVCDADGREKDGTIGEITANGTVLQLPTYEQTVRIGFTGTASANTEFYTELRVDGKAETVEAYVTRAVLITYIDSEKADPTAMDTQLDGIHIYFDGSESTERFTAFDPETREYDVTLQAADRVRRDTYTLNVVKKGTCAIVVPQIYRNGETLITGTDPLKEQWLTLASVGISDKDGSRVDTGTAAAEGALTIEISDGEVLPWTGRISSGNFSVVPHKAGKVIITLIYDDGNGTRIEEPIEHAVNYTDSYLHALVSQAEELLRNEEGRKYADGAAETLQQALTEQRAVLSRVNGMSCDSMTDAQKQFLNDASEALTQAMADFRGAELGLEVTEFAPLAEDVAEQTVAYDTKREELSLPSALRARTDGQWESINGVTWDSTPEYPSDYKYKYQFTARLPKGYKTAPGVEKLTIGLGFIFGPQRVPYYKGETLAQMLVRTMEAEEREVRYTGTMTDGFYLAQLYDPGRPGIAGTVPTYIRDMWRALYDAKPDTTPVIENTDTEEPDYLRATVDGKCKILTGITEWRVDRVFGAPGTYAFTPVLPERYKNYTVVCDYPDIQVTVLPPAGDMNDDGAVSIANAELLAAYYNGTRQLAQVQLAAADLDGSGRVDMDDVALLIRYANGVINAFPAQ